MLTVCVIPFTDALLDKYVKGSTPIDVWWHFSPDSYFWLHFRQHSNRVRIDLSVSERLRPIVKIGSLIKNEFRLKLFFKKVRLLTVFRSSSLITKLLRSSSVINSACKECIVKAKKIKVNTFFMTDEIRGKLTLIK